jgi:hypothetical protein
MANHVGGEGIDGSWKQLVTTAGTIYVIRSHLLERPLDPSHPKDVIGTFNNVSISEIEHSLTECVMDTDQAAFKPCADIWYSD